MEFGHYSRLEQLQQRLWYFSYLKYPIASLYHLLTNRFESIVSPSTTFSYVNQCTGCLRCQPQLFKNDEKPVEKSQSSSFFSKFYRSSRETVKSPAVLPSVPAAVVNPDCGVEHQYERSTSLYQMWIDIVEGRQTFQCVLTDKFQRWNFSSEKTSKENFLVKQIRFDPNLKFVAKSFLIDHDKTTEIVEPIECRVELTEDNLKYLQVNPTALIQRPTSFQPTRIDEEEKKLEKNALFLFSRHV